MAADCAVTPEFATAYRDMHEKKAGERDQFEVLVIDLIGA